MAGRLALAALLLVVCAGGVAPVFDYYVLSLSWAPNFCTDAAKAAQNPAECAVGKHIGFIVHGLWPQSNQGQGPESCGKATQVRKSLIKEMLPYMFSPGLIQHEWAAHGTCSGLSQAAFFTNVMQARGAVQVPVEITNLDSPATENPEQIEKQFANANPSFPVGAFRTSCAGAELAEVRVCFDKNLKPQACTPSAGECTRTAVQILPPR